MSASIQQLLSKDKRDSFLTKRPKITHFYKPIKQHTPFSIDTIEEFFNKTANFDEEIFCETSNYGDLIDRIVLKIVIPEVHISNSLDSVNLPDYSADTINNENYTLNIDNMIVEYDLLINKFSDFTQSAMVYWRVIKLTMKNSNINYNTVIALLKDYINTQNDIQDLYDKNDEFSATQIKGTGIYFNFSILSHLSYDYTSHANSVYNAALTLQYKNVVLQYLDDYIFYQKQYLEYIIGQRDKFIKIKATHDATYYRFAWVKDVALAMIDYVTLDIGGQQIDYHNSESLNNWYKTATKINFTDTIDTMLGNTQVLTTFDSNSKPKFELYIPLPFGCLLYPSQTIPSVSTKYQDIIVRLKLNDLYKCCFFEPDEFPQYFSNININESIKIVSASLLIDYIHLGEVERSKYSTKNIEMLIEQNRVLTFSNISKKNIILPLDFSNAVKDIMWSIRKKYNVEQMKLWNDDEIFNAFPGKITIIGQQEPYIGKVFIQMNNGDIFNNTLINPSEYVDGICEIYHSKYYEGKYKIIYASESIIVINSTAYIYPDNVKMKLYKKSKVLQNIVENENILIYGQNLLSSRDEKYYTLVQNRYRSKSSTVHKYAIAILPEMLQPAGVLNFNVVKNKKLQIEFSTVALEQATTNGDAYIISIHGKSYNALNTSKGYTNVIHGI
jgi:hypothetical protein